MAPDSYLTLNKFDLLSLIQNIIIMNLRQRKTKIKVIFKPKRNLNYNMRMHFVNLQDLAYLLASLEGKSYKAYNDILGKKLFIT